MNIDLTGRKAVVTGSTAGIGRAIAEGLARAGAAVVVNGRGQERVAAALRELRELFPKGEFIGVPADLATPEGAAELFARAPDADILVNNVGTGLPKSFFEIEDSEWIDLFELNVMSGSRASRHYVPNMTKRGWGRVVLRNCCLASSCVTPCASAAAFIQPPIISELVGPGRTELTVTPVPATVSAKPLAMAN